jgi:hypothetical protein
MLPARQRLFTRRVDNIHLCGDPKMTTFRLLMSSDSRERK